MMSDGRPKAAPTRAANRTLGALVETRGPLLLKEKELPLDKQLAPFPS